MKPNEITNDHFEQREIVSEDYWNDPRWKEVGRLRDIDEHAQANGLVFAIRADWGVD